MQLRALCMDFAHPPSLINYQPLNYIIESHQMRNTKSNRSLLAHKVASEYDMKDLPAFKSFFVKALKRDWKANGDSFQKDVKAYMKK